MSVKDLTKEQLMEIAKKPLKKAKDLFGDQYNDVQKFSLMNKIQTDENNFVPTYMIYEIYVQWCVTNDLEPWARHLFFVKFSEMFKRRKKNGDMVYLINGQGLKMEDYSKSEKEVMQSAYSKRISQYAEKRQKKKKQQENSKD